MSIKNTIVICDDEPQIRKILSISLESADYKVIDVENGRDAITQIATSHPQLVILDLGLPDRDGLSVLKEIRTWTSVPVIILSVKNSEEDIVKALDLGADDYLTKPFNTSELLARIRANIRRTIKGDTDTVFQNGDLVIDLSSRIVKKGNTEVKLTNTEYLLLVLLAKNADKVLTHRFILKEIWGPSAVENSQYLRVFIGQLRKKIEDDYSKPDLIVTESGVGYRFVSIK
ncbi:MAG: response regulator [Ignavibacterium sp.]|jgi:two-component system KDP operon response regulator KdpE|nr:response regulator [Ignavibacterium sp.]